MHKIGILGAGLISRSHAESIRTLNNCMLTAVADIREEAGQRFAEEYGCAYYQDAEELLMHADVEIVIIALPTFLHGKYVELCAQYGKHVLCEKPIEMTVEATQRMLDQVKEAGIIFMVGQVVRFWSGYTEIKELYESGELGQVHMAFASRCSTLPDWGNEWLLHPEKGAGAICDMHVHDVDFLRNLFGEIDSVYCLANKDHTGCWNHAMSSISFKSGEKAVAEAAGEPPQPLAFEIQCLEEALRPLRGAVRSGGTAQAKILGQVLPLADRFQRVGEPAGELLGRPLCREVMAKVAVNRSPQKVLVGQEFVAKQRRVERGEDAHGRVDLAQLVARPGLFQVKGCAERVQGRQLHLPVSLEGAGEVLCLVAQSGHRQHGFVPGLL